MECEMPNPAGSDSGSRSDTESTASSDSFVTDASGETDALGEAGEPGEPDAPDAPERGKPTDAQHQHEEDVDVPDHGTRPLQATPGTQLVAPGATHERFADDEQRPGKDTQQDKDKVSERGFSNKEKAVAFGIGITALVFITGGAALGPILFCGAATYLGYKFFSSGSKSQPAEKTQPQAPAIPAKRATRDEPVREQYRNTPPRSQPSDGRNNAAHWARSMSEHENPELSRQNPRFSAPPPTAIPQVTAQQLNAKQRKARGVGGR
jgi:hypothetical protein